MIRLRKSGENMYFSISRVCLFSEIGRILVMRNLVNYIRLNLRDLENCSKEHLITRFARSLTFKSVRMRNFSV